jgi:D-proline reductase (dithiol) PrdB
VREFTEKIKPPRTIFLKWPFGHPLGEPFNVLQQRAVLIEAFNALYAIDTPGTIINVPFRWRRESYERYKLNKVLIQENRQEVFEHADKSRG